MAELSDLGLNRFIYRDNSNINSTSALSSAFENTATSQGTSSGGNGGGSSQGNDQLPAKDVVPGSIIVASLIQTRPTFERVELNPDQNALLVFDSANNNVLKIDKDGLVTLDADFQREITYKTYVLPVTMRGGINFNGTYFIIPGGWSSTQTGTGIYEITHNLGTADLVITVTPFNGWYRGRVTSVTTTTFEIQFQESTYSAGLYTGETLVDTGFYFIVLVNPADI